MIPSSGPLLRSVEAVLNTVLRGPLAVLALGLGLVAEEEGPGGGVLAIHGMETGGEAVVAILDADVLGADLEVILAKGQPRVGDVLALRVVLDQRLVDLERALVVLTIPIK